MTSSLLNLKNKNKVTKTTLNALLVFLMVAALNSCALRPIASNYDYQKNRVKQVSLDSLGNGRLLIYNGAGFLHQVDVTASINMWVNKNPMGQIRAGEFAIVELGGGTYEFDLFHLDVFGFGSNHSTVIDSTTKVIRIKPTITSNDLTITNELPSNFSKFSYVEKR